MSKQLIVSAVGALKTEKPRKDGKGRRQYFILSVFDANNPLASASRIIFQKHDAQGKAMWKNGVDLHMVYTSMLGKPVDGQIVRGAVKPYKIQDKTVDNYTCAVFSNETFEVVAKEQGHELANATMQAVEVAPQEELIK